MSKDILIGDPGSEGIWPYADCYPDGWIEGHRDVTGGDRGP